MAGEEMVIAGVVEILKLLIAAYIQAARQNGAPEEQIDAMLAEAKAAFAANDPANIPDV